MGTDGRIFFVTTPALVGRRVGYELMNMDLSSGGGKLDTSPQSDFSTLCFQMSPQRSCIRAAKITGGEYELINTSPIGEFRRWEGRHFPSI